MRGFPQTSWDPNDPAVDRWLREGEVRDSALIPTSSNYVFLLELGVPGVEHSGFAVHKPERGETPLWPARSPVSRPRWAPHTAGSASAAST